MKLSRHIFLVGILLFISSSLCLSQNIMNYNFDYSIFSYDSSSNYVEIYYLFDKSSFQSVQRNNKNFTEIEFDISLLNERRDTLLNKAYLMKDSLRNESKSSESIGVLKFVIPFGKMKLKLSLIDKNNSQNNNSDEYEFYSNNLLQSVNQISNIQFASLITNDTTDALEMFDKNNYSIVPNPSLVYDDQLSTLYYYAELYNLKYENGSLSLLQELHDPQGKLVYNRKTSLPSNKRSKVQVGIINLAGLSSGAYNLTLSIIDSSGDKISQSKKKFYYYTQLNVNKKDIVRNDKDYLSSEYAVYSEEECDDLMNKIRYVATSQELNQYNLLTELNDKRNFLYQFWNKRDFDKSTTVNEYKTEVMKRVAEADKMFWALKKEGSTTDRGRVLILYGMPSEIERYPNESGVKPYEIWKYHDLEGGVVFIFGDMLGLEDYRLLHSTKRGELSQPNWIESLRGN